VTEAAVSIDIALTVKQISFFWLSQSTPAGQNRRARLLEE